MIAALELHEFYQVPEFIEKPLEKKLWRLAFRKANKKQNQRYSLSGRRAH